MIQLTLYVVMEALYPLLPAFEIIINDFEFFLPDVSQYLVSFLY